MKYWCYHSSAHGSVQKISKEARNCSYQHCEDMQLSSRPTSLQNSLPGWVVHLDTHGVQASQRKAGVQGESGQLGKIVSKPNRAGEMAQCLRALVSLPGHRFDSQYPHDSSQPPVTTAPEDLMPLASVGAYMHACPNVRTHRGQGNANNIALWQNICDGNMFETLSLIPRITTP